MGLLVRTLNGTKIIENIPYLQNASYKSRTQFTNYLRDQVKPKNLKENISTIRKEIFTEIPFIPPLWSEHRYTFRNDFVELIAELLLFVESLVFEYIYIFSTRGLNHINGMSPILSGVF